MDRDIWREISMILSLDTVPTFVWRDQGKIWKIIFINPVQE